MGDLLKAESYYLFKNIRFYIFAAIIVVGRIVGTIFNWDVVSPVMDIVFYIFTIILVLEFAHKDFQFGTMKNYVGSGVSLNRVYFGKLATCLIAILILSVINSVTKNCCAWADGTLTNFNLGSQILLLLISLEKMCVVFFICSFIVSGAFSVIISLFYDIGFSMLFDFIHNDFMDAIAPFSLGRIEQELIGSTNINMDTFALETGGGAATGDILWHLAVTTLVIAGLTILGSFLFSKREVK